MTYENFIQFIKQPETISGNHQPMLSELAAQYPYFGVAKWLHLKSLDVSDSIYFKAELAKAALYASNRRNLYYFIHPEKTPENDAGMKKRDASQGGYFDMINWLEKKEEQTGGTLQSLAEKLRAAREMMQEKPDLPKENSSQSDDNQPSAAAEAPENRNEPVDTSEREAEVKTLVRAKKYEEALPILEELCLINPKKSSYFADQIRFLKKITGNSGLQGNS